MRRYTVANVIFGFGVCVFAAGFILTGAYFCFMQAGLGELSDPPKASWLAMGVSFACIGLAGCVAGVEWCVGKIRDNAVSK